MILTWLSSILDWSQVILSYVMVRLKSTIIKSITVLTIFVILLWFSIFMYGCFHYLYMPSNIHVKKVHFQYDVNCDDASTKLCSFPIANMSLLQRGQDQFLMPGQAYSVKIYLEMPESPLNQKLGMFLLKLELYGKKGVVASSQKRSAMIRFKSSLLLKIETIISAPLYIFGMKEQKQDLSIELHEHFEDNAYNPVIGVVIEVQSKNIEIYSAILKIHAKMSGLRYLIFEYPIVSAFFCITNNLSFLIAVTLLSWYKITTITCNSLQEEKTVPTLEERRRTLRANLHKERAQPIASDQTQLQEDSTPEPVLKKMYTNDTEPVLKKMYTSANRRRTQSRDNEPEILAAGQDDSITQQHGDLNPAMEVRQRKVELNQSPIS